MRLWTLHPKYLDARGLVALWREALLAQKVLRGQTRGYKHHPQLIRFTETKDPPAAIAAFLQAVHAEATARGYQFDATKIGRKKFGGKIKETHGQLLYEWRHLQRKLKRRAPNRFRELTSVHKPVPHPLFIIVPGKVRVWEKVVPSKK
ncbi:MAG TPA: pyrimidine dimer DNA glycosylase/endonuclease V [Verrucomicrobiae bacterium]|nr:pyrimidine dimer DNA glycosylase/endonuclease V [Verrucomicrobiae bacterium]